MTSPVRSGRSAWFGVALAVAAVAGAAQPAAAETSNTSTVVQLTVIESGDRNYKAFHGAVWLEIDKVSTNYRWGGSQCGGRDISENTVQLLFAALRSGDQVAIEYSLGTVKDKQYRCITAVTFSKT